MISYLKNDVKNRTSFVVGDPFGKPQYIHTFEYFEHMLLFMSKTTIDSIISIILNKPSADDNYAYIEAQIHGDVIFKRDIECIMINKRHENQENLKYVKDLQHQILP